MRGQGFTLLELLVVLGILVTLALISETAYMRWAQQSQVLQVARELQGHLTALRAEAMRQSYTAEFQMTSSNSYETRLINPRTNSVVSSNTYTVPPFISVNTTICSSGSVSNVKVQWQAPYTQTPVNCAYEVRRAGNFISYRVAIIGERGQVVLNAI